MDVSVEQLGALSETELLSAWHGKRRAYAEKKFARDTERGRLQWQRARAFGAARGGVTERTNAVDASEELARKGQHVRELALELDLLKADIDMIALVLRLRGMHAAKPDDAAPSEDSLQEDAASFEP